MQIIQFNINFFYNDVDLKFVHPLMHLCIVVSLTNQTWNKSGWLNCPPQLIHWMQMALQIQALVELVCSAEMTIALS